MTHKTCKRCEQLKPTTEFRADPRYRDGFGSWCVECHRAKSSEWARENRARLTQKARVWRAENEDAWRKSSRAFHNRNKAARAKSAALWAKENKGLRRAVDARRKATKRQATPSWVDHAAITAIYQRSIDVERSSGIRMHVDHIVPLKHPLVCGLHVPWNLQVIPGALNESKRNKWPFRVEAPKPAFQEALL
jgi:5-methylcytosine-specific restriction endonuclease McrA